MVVGGAVIGIKIVEDLVMQFMPLKIQGLHQVYNDPDVLDDIKLAQNTFIMGRTVLGTMSASIIHLLALTLEYL
jgi:hypothetical protein